MYLKVVFLKYVLEACISNHQDCNADLYYLSTKCTTIVQYIQSRAYLVYSKHI